MPIYCNPSDKKETLFWRIIVIFNYKIGAKFSFNCLSKSGVIIKQSGDAISLFKINSLFYDEIHFRQNFESVAHYVARNPN